MIRAFLKGKERGLEMATSAMESTEEPVPDSEDVAYLKNNRIAYTLGFWTAGIARIFNPIDLAKDMTQVDLAKEVIQLLNDPLRLNDLKIDITPEMLDKLKKNK